MSSSKTVLGIFAHPDDAEFLCSGALALLHSKGWEIHIATMTPGDKGTAEHTREEISRIRRGEAKQAAALLGGSYHCLECEDVYIVYDRDTLNKATELLREIRPTMVFTTSPSDYMADHEMASRIAQTACFACGIKNMDVKAEPFEPVPHLYYIDAVEGKDSFGNEIEPGMWVNISSTIEIKERMLCCHASQRDWLMTHHGIDEYVVSMRAFAEKRGREINVKYAEGFRQHLGHGFPQENLLKVALGEFVREKTQLDKAAT